MASIAILDGPTRSTALVGPISEGGSPRVAMLSFSTKGSAEHRPGRQGTGWPRRLSVRAAYRTWSSTESCSSTPRWVPEVAEASRHPGSPVAGTANVFVFPDLDSGNIAYKVAERMGGARAYRPVATRDWTAMLHDLSRGCSAEDIVDVAVIAGLQARSSGA